MMFETLLQNRTVQVLIESFPRILLPGLAATIPLTVLSFAFAMVIAAAVALVQYARVPVLRQLRGIYLPAVLPYFRSALSLGMGLCWKSGAAAEVIGLPAGSIGEALYTAKVYFQTGYLFAWTAVIVAISVLFERLFLRLVDTAVRKAGG